MVAYAVSLRTVEFGVRLALGATPGMVTRYCVGEHLWMIAVGAAAGWLIVYAAVVDVFSTPVDGAVFGGVPLLLLAVAIAAAWSPARRAAHVDPATALRHA